MYFVFTIGKCFAAIMPIFICAKLPTNTMQIYGKTLNGDRFFPNFYTFAHLFNTKHEIRQSYIYIQPP